MIGFVKWFSSEKGYGFIRDQEKNDHFVHHTSINGDGWKNLVEDQEVTFEVGEGPTGKPCAVDVTPIDVEVAG